MIKETRYIMKYTDGTSAYKNDQDMFLSLLYHDSQKGHAIRFTLSADKLHKRTFASKDPKKIAYDGKKYNAYSTINTFRGMRRLSNEVFNYGCIYMDLDGHDLSAEVLEKQIRITEKLLSRAFDKEEMLPPTIITETGRGLGLFYIFDKSIANIDKNKGVIDYMHAVREKLYKRYDELLTCNGILLNMDPAVLDDARVARMPGTVNQNNGKTCHIIFWNHEGEKTRYCSLSDIYRVCGLDRYNRKKEKKTETKWYKFSDLRDKYFLKKRIDSLMKIQENDNYECNNRRDLICFILYSAAKQTMGRDQAVSFLNDFNNKFKRPLCKAEIDNIIRVTDRNKCDGYEGYYRLTNKWIIEKLSLTESETEACGLGASRRKIEREEAKKKTAEKRKTRREQIKEYAISHSDMTYSEIADRCGVSDRTVKRYLKDMGITRYSKNNKSNTKEEVITTNAQPEVTTPSPKNVDNSSSVMQKGQNAPQSLGCAPERGKGGSIKVNSKVCNIQGNSEKKVEVGSSDSADAGKNGMMHEAGCSFGSCWIRKKKKESSQKSFVEKWDDEGEWITVTPEIEAEIEQLFAS